MDCDNDKAVEKQTSNEKLLLQQQMLQMEHHLKEMQQQQLQQQQEMHGQRRRQRQPQKLQLQQQQLIQEHPGRQVLVDEEIQVGGYQRNNRGRHRAREHVRRQRIQQRHMRNVTNFISMIANKTTRFKKKKILETVRKKIMKFSYKLSEKWATSNRTKERFLKSNVQWLGQEIKFQELGNNAQNSKDKPTSLRGRKKVSFTASSNKTKRRRVQNLIDTSTKEEIIHAAQISLHVTGQRDAAAILKQVTTTTLKRPTRIKKVFHRESCKKPTISKEEALATFLDGNMNKKSYTAVQKRLKMVGLKIFPPYPFITEEKKNGYPDNVTITEVSAEVQLQSLVEHTVKRLCVVQHDVLMQSRDILTNVEFIFKWGCDGSSGYSLYKQKFSNNFDENQQDSAIFVISLVPIQLYCLSKKGEKIILWQNLTPSSTRYCRPIKLLMKSETVELIKTEISNINNQIAKLTSIQILLNDKIVSIKPKLILTMVDEVKKLQIRSLDDKAKVQCRKETVQKSVRSEMGLLVDMIKSSYGTTNDGNTARCFFHNPSLSASITGVDEHLIKRFLVLLEAISYGYEINVDAFNDYALETWNKYVQLYLWYFMPVKVHKLLVHATNIYQKMRRNVGIRKLEGIENIIVGDILEKLQWRM
ncbi:hypothetical protein KPH14_002635 [Odynerus spinipes]|uniref:Uncharacterized protein n=1 Tax=Odynerus spinipes TaxID=1348599 RepID=A0AAD9VLW7_9HYME|nr:hypothetical protein KPH14_002635 [Odynerus spinipes]